MRRIRLLGFVVLAGACGRAGDGGGAAVTRDSAGIAIVENTGPAWTPGQEWKVIDSAVIDIAGDFDSVTGPLRLSSGHLAITNAGSHDVRIYDSAGTLLHTSGRAGSGPGEYQNLAGIWLGPGDSIMVSDFLMRRLTVLDSAGTFQRSFSLGGTGGAPVPVGGRFDLAIPQGWFSDGSVAGVTMSFAINQRRDGVYRDSISAFRYGSDGLVRDTIARFPGIEMESMTMTMGTQSFSAPTVVPLGRVSVSAAQGERFYLAQNNSWEIEVRERNGKLLRLIRLDARPKPITPNDIAAHRQSQLDLIEGMPMMRAVPAPVKSQIKTRIEQAKYPPTFPFLSAMLLDGDGNIWAQEVASPRMKASVFAVVDSSGVLLGRVTMPPKFRPTSIGTGIVYGVWTDADDVQHLRAYPLRRGP